MLNWFFSLFTRPATHRAELNADGEKPKISDAEPAPDEFVLFTRRPAVSSEYDFWADGLPPDWESRRAMARSRDNDVCQAPGCAETKALDVHHIRPKRLTPDHRLENLVSLCRIHHAIAHLESHKIEVTCDRCTVVSSHWKRSKYGREFFVKASIKCFKTVTPEELNFVREHFGLQCRVCASSEWQGYLRRSDKEIWTHCPGCNSRLEFEVGLREQSATQLATEFVVTRNHRSFTFGAEDIRLAPPKFFEGCPWCLSQGKSGYLIEKRGKRGKFLGCSAWPDCGYTKDC